MNYKTLKIGSRGDDVKKLQKSLGITADGIFGKQTAAALKSYQKKNNLTVDGIAGKQTFGSLYNQVQGPKRPVQGPKQPERKKDLSFNEKARLRGNTVTDELSDGTKTTRYPKNKFDFGFSYAPGFGPGEQKIDLSQIDTQSSPIKPDPEFGAQVQGFDQQIGNFDQQINQITNSDFGNFQGTTANAPQGPDTSRASLLAQEIDDLERTIAGKEDARFGLSEDLGLNADKEKLQELLDRQIEIPIETQQALRGKGATQTDFGKTTRPQLEDASLAALAQSRKVTALTSVINQKIDAEFGKLEYIYNSKVKQLEKIEKSNADLLSQQEKYALEERKFQNELFLIGAKSDADTRKDLIGKLAEKGYTGNFGNLSSMDMGDLTNLAGQYMGSSSMTFDGINSYEQAYLKGGEDFAKAWQEVEKEAGQKDAIFANVAYTLDTIQNIKDAGNAINGIVGPNKAARTSLAGTLDGRRTKAYTAMKNLAANATLDRLGALKATGATMGALNAKEGGWLEDGGSRFGFYYDENVKDGQKPILLGSKLTEKDFNKELEIYETIVKKVRIANEIGSRAFAEKGLRDEDPAVIDALYDQLKSGNAFTQESSQSAGAQQYDIYTGQPVSFRQGTSPTVQLIKEKEGFRSQAYLDSAGVPTIGYGTTRINGQPVQLGMQINEQQAEQIMLQQIEAEYSNFKNKVTRQLSPNQEAALTSFEYNLGPGIWNKGSGPQIIAAVNRGDMQTAGQIMQKFNKAKVNGKLTPLNGLTARRQQEAQLLTSYA